MTSYSILKTKPLGDLLLTASGEKLTGIYFHDRKHSPKAAADWRLDPGQPVLKQARRELEEYLDGKRAHFSIPIQAEGTDFQREIWRQIGLVPFGETITYTELARRAGKPAAVRAAGMATGQNPHSIVVPCHRIIGKNGSLTGYAGGMDRKKNLLKLEGFPVNRISPQGELTLK